MTRLTEPYNKPNLTEISAGDRTAPEVMLQVTFGRFSATTESTPTPDSANVLGLGFCPRAHRAFTIQSTPSLHLLQNCAETTNGAGTAYLKEAPTVLFVRTYVVFESPPAGA
jgi:hypothetical protein